MSRGTLIFFILSLALPQFAFAQTDSLAGEGDSTISVGSVQREDLEHPIVYSARDSIVYDLANKMIYLYGIAKMTYGDINLEAAYIAVDLNTFEISSHGAPDSSGAIAGTPVFTQGEETFASDSLAYNFRTKKGVVSDLRTNEGEGFIIIEKGKFIKLDSTDVIYARDGKYTTCDLPHPHFYLQTNKLKLIPKDKILTGPAYFVIEDVPIPAVLPFGFFPAGGGRSSGLILPTYGENKGNSLRQGFFLQNGGYYLGLGPHADLAVLGSIYSGGSWDLGLRSNYNYRYRFNGNFDFRYAYVTSGISETADFTTTREFKINLSHHQDIKARPGSTFSAAIDAGSQQSNRYNSETAADRLASALSSSVNFSKSLLGSQALLSLSGQHSQNLQTRQVDLTLPRLDFNVRSQFPFRRLGAPGKRQWWDDLAISYNLKAGASISAIDSNLFDTLSRFGNWQRGLTHSIPIVLPLKISYFTLTNTVSYQGWLYFDQVEKIYNDTGSNKGVETIRIPGITYANTASANTSLSTNLYGLVRPKILGIQAIRQVVIPRVGATYRPDFLQNVREVRYDSTGKTREYSIFEGGSFGAPPIGKEASIDFSVNNVFEMKINGKDSTQKERKVKLLDQLNFASSYNFLRDSMKLAPLRMNAATVIASKFNLSSEVNVNPYYLSKKDSSFVDKLAIKNGQGLGQITRANLTVGTTFRSKAKKVADQSMGDYQLGGGFQPSNIPWSMNAGFALEYNKPLLERNITQVLNLGGEFQITPRWHLGGTTNYNLKTKEVGYTTINIDCDLHCWVLSFQWLPIGYYKSYVFSLRIKANTLKDIKLDKRKPFQAF